MRLHFLNEYLLRLIIFYSYFISRFLKGKFIIRNIAGAIRVGAGRKSVQANLAKALTERNHKLDHLYTPKILQLKKKVNPDADNDEDSIDEILDDAGYKSVEKVGVISNTFLVYFG